jgi:branched-chain amino acid transport system substrate-binding protein
MKSRQSKILVFIAVVALVIAFTIATTASAEELKVGVIATLTGPGTPWGKAVFHGAEMAAEDVNQKGGLQVQGKKYQIKIIEYDDGYTGKGGQSAATKLVFEDKVKFIVGPIGTAPWMAAKDVTERNEVIVLAGSYSKRAIKDAKYAFRVFVTPEEFAPVFTKWISENYPNHKKVAILGPDDETGWETVSSDVKGYEQNGFNIVFKEFNKRGLKDFFPLLTKMMTKNPDILELDGEAPGDCGVIAKQARQMGFKGMFVKTGGSVTGELVRIAGKEAVEGSIVYMPLDPTDPKVSAFIKRYKDKYNSKMNLFLPSFYDMSKLLFHAIEKAQTVSDTKKIVKVMEQIDFSKWDGGLTGPIGWTGKEAYGVNHQAIQTIAVGKVVDGKEKVVAVLGKQ